MAYYQNDEFRPYSLTRSGLSMYNKNAAPSYMNQYSAPTKAEAIDWLESKGVYISIYYKIGRYHYNVEYKNGHFRIEVCGSRETRLEAKDAAIIKACELL